MKKGIEAVNIQNIALKLAEAILIHKGEITIDDIKAMPMVDDPQLAILIAEYLAAKFKTEITTDKKKQKGRGSWEQQIILCA